MRKAFQRAWIPGSLLAASAVWMLPLLPDPDRVLFWRGGEFSDLLISHWPSAILVQRSLSLWRQIPLWNPTILSGTPFVADPLSGLWYPPNWLAAAIPEAWAFNLIFLLHLAWSGLGGYRLARKAGVSGTAALLAGIALTGMPKLIGHLGLGHLSLVEAVAWTPWVLERFWTVADALGRGAARWPREVGVAGASLGLVFLIDPRWFPYLALLSLAITLWRLTIFRRKLQPGFRRWLGAGALIAGITSGCMASLAIPLWEHMSLSTRAELGAAEQAAYALPPAKLLGLLAPDFGGWPEWQIYPGVVLILLGLLALLSGSGGARLWGGLAVAAWAVALGDRLPVHGWLTAMLPGFSYLRVPARALFSSGLAVAMLAGLGVEQALQKGWGLRLQRRSRLAAFGLLLLVSALGAAVLLAGEAGDFAERFRLARAYLLAGGLVALSWMLLEARKMLAARWLALGWIALVIVDLGLINLSLLEARDVGGTGEATIRGLTDRLEGSHQRAFSPSYSLRQPSAAAAGLELSDGVHPLQLISYRSYLAEAVGYDPQLYSVTVPPYPVGRPEIPWPVRPDPGLLGTLNVGYLASEYPVDAEGWIFDGRTAGTYFYRNPQVRPRAWVQEPGEKQSWRPVEMLQWSPSRIAVTAAGPGTLVLSEVIYPGWRVEVDGEQAPMKAERGILRAVELSEGLHRVDFRFVPISALLGLVLTLGTALAVLLLWIRR